jgi:hypothetical protein
VYRLKERYVTEVRSGLVTTPTGETVPSRTNPRSLKGTTLETKEFLRFSGWQRPDPPDLMRPFPADLMRMWPISTRVNKPENDDRSILEPVQLASDAA